jgi:hypothetical protein
MIIYAELLRTLWKDKNMQDVLKRDDVDFDII